MRFIGYIPSMSSHGGMFFRVGYRVSTLESGSPLLNGDWHVCPRKHHGVRRLRGTGFATDSGRRYACRLDSCGCLAYIRSSSNVVATD